MKLLRTKPLNTKKVLLNSIILGISSIPLAYMAIGTLFYFHTVFSLIVVPVYLLVIGILILFRLTPSPRLQPWLKIPFQIVCFFITIIITALISDFNLQSLEQRLQVIALFGLLCTLFWSFLLSILNVRLSYYANVRRSE